MGKISWERASLCQKNSPIYADMSHPVCYALIVAAGKGLRMKSSQKKQYLMLGGIPILSRTIKAFHNHEDIRKIILVVPKEDMEYCNMNILEPYGLIDKTYLVSGGDQRQQSVYNGLKFIYEAEDHGDQNSIVLIHDGVRPFINYHMICECIAQVIKSDTCIPAIRISDTVRRVQPDLNVVETIDRNNLYLIQTPQCFYLTPIFKAYENAEKTFFTGTDDASIFEHNKGEIKIIQGSKFNIKITTPDDMDIGELYLQKA